MDVNKRQGGRGSIDHEQVYVYNWSGGKKISDKGVFPMKFIYGENAVAKRIGLTRKALYSFRTEHMTEGIHFDHVQHDSRKKTALSDAGLSLLEKSLANGLLTDGVPVAVDIAEIRTVSLLSGLPTGAVENQATETTGQNSEKKPRAVIGLLPAPAGCPGCAPIEAVLIVAKPPQNVPNKRVLVCTVKDGQMPEHHVAAVTDSGGMAYVQVTKSEQFVFGMEIPARHMQGNIWECSRPCPRRRGKW